MIAWYCISRSCQNFPILWTFCFQFSRFLLCVIMQIVYVLKYVYINHSRFINGRNIWTVLPKLRTLVLFWKSWRAFLLLGPPECPSDTPPSPSSDSWDRPRAGEWGAARLWIVICGFGKRFWGQHSELRETRVQVLTLPCIKCMILHKSLKTFQALVCLFCKMGMEIPALACEHAFVSPRALHRSSTALLLLSLLLT